MALESAEIEKSYYQAFLAHPQIAAVTANRNLIDEWLGQRLLVTNVTNIGKAITTLGDKLAKSIHNKPTVAPAEPAAVTGPEPVDPQLILTRLRDEMSSRDPNVREKARKELRKIAVNEKRGIFNTSSSL